MLRLFICLLPFVIARFAKAESFQCKWNSRDGKTRYDVRVDLSRRPAGETWIKVTEKNLIDNVPEFQMTQGFASENSVFSDSDCKTKVETRYLIGHYQFRTKENEPDAAVFGGSLRCRRIIE